MGVRTGHVADIPARIMRVGFVGELGYEIHVPVGLRRIRSGTACWRPARSGACARFGVEAQRVLRLEKGHVIVGQDTDGLTNPLEIGMGGSGQAKPFFVGGAALAAHRQRGVTRKLVGFMTEGQDVIPKECHLVIEGGEIAGHVTSCARSAAVGRVIGLAYVRPHQAAVGSIFTIRVDGGQLVTARVVAVAVLRSRQRTAAGMNASSDQRRSFIQRRMPAARRRSPARTGLKLADLSLVPRWGMKGRDAFAWLGRQGASVPARDNAAERQRDGSLIARLSPGEALVLAPLPDGQAALQAPIEATAAGGPRRLLSGAALGQPLLVRRRRGRRAAHVREALRGRSCACRAFPMDRSRRRASHAFRPSSSAHDIGNAVAFSILADSASAEYLWDCLIDAMDEFSGVICDIESLSSA